MKNSSLNQLSSIYKYTQEQSNSWRNYKNSKNLYKSPVKDPVVAYGGTTGSYSEDACIKFFKDQGVRIACKRFEDVFKSVTGGVADYGVIPIENSTTGSVKGVLDLLDKYNCYIIGETQVRVDHCLLGTKDSSIEDITDIFSHEQSLMQCSIYLEEHSKWRQHTYANNALAAEFIKLENNKNFGAIASERAGIVHDLKILDKHINFLDINTTRFIIIANHPEDREADKISISFAVGHKPGSLVRVLNIFDKYQLNLCKIESRPNHVHNWEYNFFIDIEGNIDSEHLDETIEEVISETTDFRFLGSYKANLEN